MYSYTYIFCREDNEYLNNIKINPYYYNILETNIDNNIEIQSFSSKCNKFTLNDIKNKINVERYESLNRKYPLKYRLKYYYELNENNNIINNYVLDNYDNYDYWFLDEYNKKLENYTSMSFTEISNLSKFNIFPIKCKKIGIFKTGSEAKRLYIHSLEEFFKNTNEYFNNKENEQIIGYIKINDYNKEKENNLIYKTFLMPKIIINNNLNSYNNIYKNLLNYIQKENINFICNYSNNSINVIPEDFKEYIKSFLEKDISFYSLNKSLNRISKTDFIVTNNNSYYFFIRNIYRGSDLYIYLNDIQQSLNWVKKLLDIYKGKRCFIFTEFNNNEETYLQELINNYNNILIIGNKKEYSNKKIEIIKSNRNDSYLIKTELYIDLNNSENIIFEVYYNKVIFKYMKYIMNNWMLISNHQYILNIC